MIGYLSGPITGVEGYEQKFAEAEQKAKNLGYSVINPVKLREVVPIEELDYADIMDIDMYLLYKADCLIHLQGWEGSTGAGLEHFAAMKMGKKIFSIEDLPICEAGEKRWGKDGPR
ncbi:hypothetical protein HMPREF1986_00330 [Oribacterium sp. oral taxon 078 str. F0263]|uniref:DUF4406 domain-containing protein n=1 Tax=Oribacterium sp. oral taxon 078 TaxID=652706 RepID=UPI0003ADC78D|nr:DUF4406 domain-containing protein [Oribacterium sp. oral taxon 078]ERL22719.1 hypothetical protein HMPREF1986_00330 [Oribacterium sp. oral taxon 078 str. F0263]